MELQLCMRWDSLCQVVFHVRWIRNEISFGFHYSAQASLYFWVESYWRKSFVDIHGIKASNLIRKYDNVVYEDFGYIGIKKQSKAVEEPNKTQFDYLP